MLSLAAAELRSCFRMSLVRVRTSVFRDGQLSLLSVGLMQMEHLCVAVKGHFQCILYLGGCSPCSFQLLSWWSRHLQ